MKKTVFVVASLLLIVALSLAFISCSGGGSSDTPAAASASTGKVVGKVSNNTTGAGIANATVTDGTVSTTAGADGSFTLDNLATASGKVLTISASNFAFTSKITNVIDGNTSRVDVALQPVAASISIASLATAQSLTVPNSPAQVDLPANGLATGAGGAPSMPVTANLTPIDPSSNPQLMPGNFTTSAGTQIESFGAMEVSFKDNSGASLNLTSGQTATIRIPVAATDQLTAPATMPAFYYNSTTGQWVQEGTLTLTGTAPNKYYTGTVTHFSYWNADQVYNTTCITGKVVNSSGAAVAGARVEGQGRDYTGTSTAFTAADGTFTLQVKANSTVIVTASTSDALTNSEIVSTGAVGGACTAITTDLTLGAIIGSSGSGSAKIRLTWGTDPNDLDSHLTGPDSATAGTRFHVYYPSSSRGSLTGNPFAELDVDDTSSFGPEVVTISKFIAGTYRYSVHHFSSFGTGDFRTSPARVELTLNGATTIYTPPAGATTLGSKSVWQVFELVVDGGGNVTITPLNTYIPPTVIDSAVTAPALKGATKPAIADWVW